MNHDATHCKDYTPVCPKKCERAMLMIDLEARRKEYINVPLSWSHFRGTAECMRGDSA